MKTLGIIGGLGPMATAHFLELIIAMTDVKTDQEHLDTIIFNRPDVPDRTAHILDSSMPSPLPSMLATAQTLESLGATCICSPCVTSHYFFKELSEGVHVPFLNMVRQTVLELKKAGKTRAGIMATTGTLQSQLFQAALSDAGIEYILPDQKNQQFIMNIIYNNIKAGLPADMGMFAQASDFFFSRSCDSIILGCTELSLVKKDNSIGAGFIDSMEALAKICLEICEKPVKEKYFTLI